MIAQGTSLDGPASLLSIAWMSDSRVLVDGTEPDHQPVDSLHRMGVFAESE